MPTPPSQILITNYCKNSRQPVNAIRRQNAEFLNIKVCGTHSNGTSLSGYIVYSDRSLATLPVEITGTN